MMVSLKKNFYAKEVLKLKKLIPLLLIICMIFAGCGDDSDFISSETGEVAEPEIGGTLKMGCVPVDTLNPLLTLHASVADVLSLIYEGMFVTLPDLTVEPVLAEEYTASENNTVYTIKLRDSVKFHNGRSLTAEDVVSTLGYIAIYGGRYTDVVAEMEAYYAEGDDTVVIRLKRSISDFVNNLDFPVLPTGLSDVWLMPGSTAFTPIGTGPYKYSGSVGNKDLRLEANRNWHFKDKGLYIEKIDVSILTDEDTIVSAFDVGSIDVLSTSWKNISDMNLTSSMFNVFECEQNRYTYIGINCNSMAFDSAKERKKLASAIDNEAIAEDIMIGNATPAVSPVRESVYYNSDIEVEDKPLSGHDRREDISKLVECRLLYNSGSKTKSRLASTIKQQLEANGYIVTLDEQPFEVYSEMVMLDKYDLYIGEVQFDNCADISRVFGSSASGGRLCNYYSTEFDNLIMNLGRMGNKEDKTIAWNNFKSYFINNAIQIPLYFTNGALLVNKKISGTPAPNISNLYYGISKMYIEDDK